jgi:hypothetical protein
VRTVDGTGTLGVTLMKRGGQTRAEQRRERHGRTHMVRRKLSMARMAEQGEVN